MQLWCAERVFVKGKLEKDWGVLVDEDGIIQAIGPCQSLVSKARAVHHYPSRILLPPFVNPHHHGFLRVFRGIFDFNISYEDAAANLIRPLCSAIDHELFDAAYRVALAEQALAGIGTLGEFHYLHNGSYPEAGQAGFADRIAKIALEMGLRLTLIYGFFDQGSSEEGKAFIQPLDASIDAFMQLHKTYEKEPLINIIPGVHGLDHASPEAIIAAAELAEAHNSKWHIQLAERPSDLESSQIQYGTTPLRALDKMGVLNKRMVVINGTLLDDEELALMKKNGVSAVLCPSANLAKSDEFPNTLGFLREQIPFAIGSDGLCINNDFSVPDEIKWLEFSQRSLQKTMNVLSSQAPVDSLWDLGTSLPAGLLGIPSVELMPGIEADFMLLALSQPYAKPHYHHSDRHFMNQVLFGWNAQARVTHLMIRGRMVVKNGHLEQDLLPSYQKLEQWSEAFLRTMRNSAKKTETAVEFESTQP